MVPTHTAVEVLDQSSAGERSGIELFGMGNSLGHKSYAISPYRERSADG
jgi:hypothetical protein